MYEESPKCKCGEYLEFDTDTGLQYGGNVVTLTIYGHCPKCEKKYKWDDVYILSNWDNLEEE